MAETQNNREDETSEHPLKPDAATTSGEAVEVVPSEQESSQDVALPEDEPSSDDGKDPESENSLEDEEDSEDTSDVEEKPTSPIAVLRDYCMRVYGADCSRCARACPAGAISFAEDGRPVIDNETCTQCGICLGICDAFTSKHVTMKDLHQRFQRIAQRGEQPVITCEDYVPDGFKTAANVVVLPCLATLSPEFWTLLLAENIDVKISVDFAYCATCLRTNDIGEMLYSHAIQTAEDATQHNVGYLKELPAKENLLADWTSQDTGDRRGILSNIMSDVGDITTGKRHLRNSKVIQDFVEQREKARAQARLNLSDGLTFADFIPKGTIRKTMWPKREMLIEAIRCDQEVADKIAVVISETNPNLCACHGACADICPTGACSIDPNADELLYDPQFCNGCGLCVKACPEGAIQLVEKTAQALFVGQDTNEETTDDAPISDE